MIPEWGLERPRPSLPCTGRRGKDNSNVAPFLTTKLAACIHLLLDVMRSKRFVTASDLDSNLMPKEKNQITIRKVCAVMQSLLRRPNHYSGYG